MFSPGLIARELTRRSVDEPERQVFIVSKADNAQWAGLRTAIVET
jgi:hypothetical protein